MSDPVLSVRGLGKAYTLAHRRASYRTLQEDLLGLPRRLLAGLRAPPRETFWALREAAFEVHAGEVLGIIGRNGAGKSTLLKLLARITEPTTGCAELRGRVGSLLEVGTGFHPELTGRENIFLSGAVLGMSRAEIARRFDAIVAFADVERFLDTPAKHYSSGMYLRLAFAVAAHLEPDILLLDEVLAVGDAEFQKKCLGVMEGIAGSGRTVLFVSHNLGVVENLCPRTLLLERGRIAADGPSREVVARYLAAAGDGALPLPERHDRRGDGRLRFTRLEVVAGDVPRTGQELRLRMHYAVAEGAASLRNVSFSVSVNGLGGGHLLVFFTEETQHNLPSIDGAGWVECTIPFLPLAAGSYAVNLYAAVSGAIADYVLSAATFTVDDGEYYRGGARHPEHPATVAAHRWSSGRDEPWVKPRRARRASRRPASACQACPEDLGDPLARPAVPERRDTARPPRAFERGGGGGQDALRLRAHHGVGALEHRDRPLGRLAQREAGHPQGRGLLLQAARVRQHQRGAGGQVQELQVAQRVAEGDGPVPRREEGIGRGAEASPGARVHREDHPDPAAHRLDRPEQPVEHRRVVHVGGPVQGEHGVLAVREPEPRQDAGGPGAGERLDQRIDHHVADPVDVVGRGALAQQVRVGVGRGREQQLAQPVGDEPVDLLRHRQVARSRGLPPRGRRGCAAWRRRWRRPWWS